MKTGRSLTELATEIERQYNTKKDYIADTRRLKMEPMPSGGVVLQGVNGGMTLRPIAHQQMGATLGIPKPYYDRMLADAPDLLSLNVNRWLERQEEKKLVRTLDGEVRAILSPSYRPLDNFDLAHAVMPKLHELKAGVISAEITEGRFYLKAITDKIQGEVKQGDLIQAGVVISNSEVGHGSLRVQALDFRLVCTNGMIRETAIRKAHLGRSSRGHDVIEDAREWFRDETRAADDRAFFLKVQDATAAMFDAIRFDKRLDEYREIAGITINREPEEAVEILAKKIGLNEGERKSVLRNLFAANDLTAWGLANAVTRTAQDVESYDRATELEAIGGNVIELSQSEWKMIV